MPIRIKWKVKRKNGAPYSKEMFVTTKESAGFYMDQIEADEKGYDFVLEDCKFENVICSHSKKTVNKT